MDSKQINNILGYNKLDIVMNERFRIYSNGNIGIGIKNPSAKLQVLPGNNILTLNNNGYIIGNDWVEQPVNRIYSEIDPYGEEDWSN